MSPHGTISTIYRAEVRVPDEVYEAFGHTKEYENVSCAALKAGPHLCGGSDHYPDIIEWAEGPVRRDCEDFIDYWHNRILQWQERLRSMG